jgi:type IV pilus assembly protein PilW
MKLQHGFSMIDAMVGIVIGMMVAIAVYGTMAIVEAQRRTTVGSNGALEAGMAGVYAMQRDIKAAGVGVWQNSQAVCGTINIYYNGATVADGAAIAPAIIAPGAADANPDSITVAYSDSVLANNGIPLVAQMTSASAAMRAANARGIAVNDLIIVGDPGTSNPCTLMQATGTSNSGFGWDIAHAANSWNPSNPAAAFTSVPLYVANAVIFDINNFNWLRYRVNNGNLEVVNLITGTVDVAANDIVQLKAYYGTSNGTTPQIEQWVPATGAWASPLDAAHIKEIRAVRMVVVARSQHSEKPSVVGGACDATTTAPTSWPGGPTIDLSGDANWRCYKYRTLTLVAPLKNLIYGTSS